MERGPIARVYDPALKKKNDEERLDRHAATALARTRRDRLRATSGSALPLPEVGNTLCQSCTDVLSALLNCVSFGDQPTTVADLAPLGPLIETDNSSVDASVTCQIYGSFDALEESAHRGCDACRVFRQKLILDSGPEGEDCPVVKYTNIVRENAAVHVSRHWFANRSKSGPPDDDEQATWEFSRSCLNLNDITLLWIPEYAQPNDNAAKSSEELTARPLQFQSLEPDLEVESERTFDQLRSWLDLCQAEHSLCCDMAPSLTDTTTTFMPTRVLQIPDSLDDHHIRLVLSDSITAPGADRRYTTLSYSWGTGAAHFKTTPENCDGHFEGIDVAELPKTFRDAITITRRIGCKYLWIDALCIIQPTEHNHSDWDKEVVTMCEIYRRSHVTIAASLAENVQQGCFTYHPHKDLALSPVRIDGLMDVPRNWDADEEANEFWINPDRLHWDVDNLPLSLRGWVLQERLLSKRTIHWTDHGLFWECVSMKANDCFLSSPSDNDMPVATTRVDWELIVKSNYSGVCWHLLTQQYSFRQLTHQSDRLVALSGIAQTFSEQRPRDVYLAGLWLNTLHADLLWEVSNPAFFATISKPSDKDQVWSSSDADARLTGMPTWSWASIPHSFLYTAHALQGDGESKYLLSAVNAKFDADWHENLATVKVNSILVRGKVKFIPLRSVKSAREFSEFGRDGLESAVTYKPNGLTLKLDTKKDDEWLRNAYAENPDLRLGCLRLYRKLRHDRGPILLQYYLVIKLVREEMVTTEISTSSNEDEGVQSGEEKKTVEVPWPIFERVGTLQEGIVHFGSTKMTIDDLLARDGDSELIDGGRHIDDGHDIVCEIV